MSGDVSGVAVRPARSEEAALVAELAAATFPLACPPGMSDENIAAFIEENLGEARFEQYLASDEAEVCVYDEDGSLLGYTLAFRGAKAVPADGLGVDALPAMLLSKCYARPEQHGKGIARALLQAVLGSAREHGMNGVWLNVNSVNHRAQRFYEKHGFVRVGAVRFVVGDEELTDPVYQLTL